MQQSSISIPPFLFVQFACSALSVSNTSARSSLVFSLQFKARSTYLSCRACSSILLARTSGRRRDRETQHLEPHPLKSQAPFFQSRHCVDNVPKYIPNVPRLHLALLCRVTETLSTFLPRSQPPIRATCEADCRCRCRSLKGPHVKVAEAGRTTAPSVIAIRILCRRPCPLK
ncbi:hypothetical protein F5Y15DRAFT_319087 [Xylariaceae sp. FL0016]|nr:hypothetical protein F5Y15DRAFT_319087 [Xylariaceae sp. FL0016]